MKMEFQIGIAEKIESPEEADKRTDLCKFEGKLYQILVILDTIEKVRKIFRKKPERVIVKLSATGSEIKKILDEDETEQILSEAENSSDLLVG